MPLLDEAIVGAEWTAALDDADLGPSRCKLSVMSAVVGDARSVHYPPGRELGADLVSDKTLAAELSRPANRDRHRIAQLDTQTGEVLAPQAVLLASLVHTLSPEKVSVTNELVEGEGSGGRHGESFLVG